MRILRASTYRTMPWKNGGGTTTEIAVHPKAAGLDAFEWRISMARVETDGPFSAFPDIDRTLAVLDGQGIVIDVKGEKPVTLTRASKPHAFPADVQTTTALVDGPITDLNVMTRRGSWTQTVERLQTAAPVRLELETAATLLLLAAGSATVRCAAGEQATLSALDCLCSDAPVSELAIEPHAESTLFLIRLDRVR